MFFLHVLHLFWLSLRMHYKVNTGVQDATNIWHSTGVDLFIDFQIDYHSSILFFILFPTGRPLQQQRQQQPTVVKANNLDRRKINAKVKVYRSYVTTMQNTIF